MGYYDPPDPLIFPCPISGRSNEDCDALLACDNLDIREDEDGNYSNCLTCGQAEDTHHDCYDEADRAGVFDPPEPYDDRI